MKFTEFYKNCTAKEKAVLAVSLDTSTAYLSQIANGHRVAGRKFIFAIERATGGAVKAHELYSSEIQLIE